MLQGEFGVDGLFVGVPVVLGRGGLERVFEITLTADEQVAFERSAAAVRELVEKLPGLTPGRRAVPIGAAGLRWRVARGWFPSASPDRQEPVAHAGRPAG